MRFEVRNVVRTQCHRRSRYQQGAHYSDSEQEKERAHGFFAIEYAFDARHSIFVETNAGWLSWLMNTVDYYQEAFQQYEGWVWPDLAAKPSEYIARQIHATFQDDPVALRNLPLTGVSPLLWGSDFPHAEGTFPHSRETLRRLLGDISLPDAEQIVGGTAVDLFSFDHSVLRTPV